MGETFTQLAAIVSAVSFLAIALFHLLLAFGFPYGEAAYGGVHKGVLPKKFRIASLISIIILLFNGFIFLLHARVLPIEPILATNILVWVFTIFLGLNTLGNFVSKSKKEKVIMTPLCGVTFLSCLVVALYS